MPELGIPRVAPGLELSEVCSEFASLFHRRWGRGPVWARAYWAGPDILLVVLENGHTPAEKTMRAAGHIQEILGGRRLLQGLVEDELRELVCRITGRTVRACLSATRLAPDVSAEIFLLERESGATDTA